MSALLPKLILAGLGQEYHKEGLVTQEPAEHNISLTMVKAPPAEVDAGALMALQCRVSCSSACDLRGSTARIIGEDGALVKETNVTQSYGVNETDVSIVRAPTKPGEYTWTAVFPAQERRGVLHGEDSTSFTFAVKPHHATSMTAWDVPSPTTCGDEFRVKVGVKCSAQCLLAGREVEIYGQDGVQVSAGTLSDAPYSDAVDLYWTEVELKAPDIEGCYTWEARFPEPGLEFQHEQASHSFGFRTVKPPEHVVTVEVTDQDAKTHIENASVVLHPYRGYADERGIAEVEVPKGQYRLYVSKNDYQTFQTDVEVAGDTAVKVGLSAAPPDPSPGG